MSNYIVKLTDNEYKNYTNKNLIRRFNTPQEEYEFNKTQFQICSKCKINKSKIYYGFNTSGKDPFNKDGFRLIRGDCLECNSTIGKKKRILEKETKAKNIVKPEDNKCEICKKVKKLFFDHCHITNTFRGWLCNECNRSIGMLCNDDLQRMIDAINYLNKKEKKI